MDAVTQLRVVRDGESQNLPETPSAHDAPGCGPDAAALVADHLWLARAVANRYRNRGEEFDDLLQVACMGLVEAAHRYDCERGDFIAFAVPTITGVIKRHFRDHGWLVRPSRRTQELVAGVRREWSDLAQELGQLPTNGQLAERLGETVEDVAKARCVADGYRPLSIDVLADGADRLDLANGSNAEQVEARVVVHRALRKLDSEDRRLIWMRFYEERSQSDIAERLGTSQMQISRRLARLMRRLQHLIGIEQQSPLVA